MATSLKLMDTNKKGKRVKGLTSEWSNAWHVTLNGLVDLVKMLLGLGMKYVLLGKLQSDALEAEFGIIRQMSGGNYIISVEQVMSSLTLRRVKLYHKLELEDTNCCKGKLADKDKDIELVDDCFEETSNLSESERAILYYISGYVAFKENIGKEAIEEGMEDESEFTKLVSRGKLSYSSRDLFDLSQYIYCFFKKRENKCCTNIFLQAYK